MEVFFPERADGAARLRAIDVPLEISFALEGMRDTHAVVVNDHAVYLGAGPSGADVVLRSDSRGVEDFLILQQPLAKAAIRYRVSLQGVAGLRLFAGSLEYLDARGYPRLRTKQPWVEDSLGQRKLAELSLHGCSYDQSGKAPWDRAVTDPGADICELEVSWDDTALKYPVVIDPAWHHAGSLHTARSDHTATLLANGDILIVGGRVDKNPAQVELYRHSTDGVEGEPITTAIAGPLSPATEWLHREYHTATRLRGGSGTDDYVLVFGGYDASGVAQSTSWLYSASDQSWSDVVVDPSLARAEHSAVALDAGGVFIVGGLPGAGPTTVDQPLRFDPATASIEPVALAPGITAMDSRPATPKQVQFRQRAAFLTNYVYESGGCAEVCPAPPLPLLQRIEVKAGVWLPKVSGTARAQHTMTPIRTQSGKDQLLLVGGNIDGPGWQLYDANEEKYGASGPAWSGVEAHTATPVPNAETPEGVVFVGGLKGDQPHTQTQVYLVEHGWQDNSIKRPLNVARGHHTTTLVNGETLVSIGGVTLPLMSPHDSIEYIPIKALGRPCLEPSDCLSGYCESGVCCDIDCTGACESCSVAGGSSQDGHCEILPKGHACGESDVECHAFQCGGGNRDACNEVVVEDGTSCDDGDDSTPTDACQSGLCVPLESSSNSSMGGSAGSPNLSGTTSNLGANTGNPGNTTTINGGGASGSSSDSEGTPSPTKNPYSCALSLESHPSSLMLACYCALVLVARRRRRESRDRLQGPVTALLAAGWLVGAGCGGDDSSGPSGDASNLTSMGVTDVGGSNSGGTNAGGSDAGGSNSGGTATHSSSNTDGGTSSTGGATTTGNGGAGGTPFECDPLDVPRWGVIAEPLDIELPTPRLGFALGSSPNTAYFFGGASPERGIFGDLWLWNFDDTGFRPWLPEQGVVPMPRVGHAIAADGSLPWLFGGVTQDSDGNQLMLGDGRLEVLRWTDSEWVEGCEGQCDLAPSPRRGHAVVTIPDLSSGPVSVLLVGGQDETGPLGDTWLFAFDSTGWGWSEICTECGFTPRFGHALAYDATWRTVVLDGGTNDATALSDTFEFDGAVWSEQTLTRDAPIPRAGHALQHFRTDQVSDGLLGVGVNAEEADAPTEVWVIDLFVQTRAVVSGLPSNLSTPKMIGLPNGHPLLLAVLGSGNLATWELIPKPIANPSGFCDCQFACHDCIGNQIEQCVELCLQDNTFDTTRCSSLGEGGASSASACESLAACCPNYEDPYELARCQTFVEFAQEDYCAVELEFCP